jgi:mannose-6-phosphate isomerase
MSRVAARRSGRFARAAGVDDQLSSPNLGGLDRFAFETRRIEKPWGWELIWAHADDYLGKLLFVRAGHSLSLQFHRQKDESWYVQEGRAEVEMGAPGEALTESEIVGPGTAFRLRPGTVHRIKAIDDTLMLEVSTPHLDDVVRLEDEYGREGTSAP